MRQENNFPNTGERTRLSVRILGAYLWGIAGGLLLYPYISFQALLAVALLLTGTALIIASLSRAGNRP